MPASSGSNYVRHVLANTDDSVTRVRRVDLRGNLANLADIADDPRYRYVHGGICDRDVVTAAIAGHGAVVRFAARPVDRFPSWDPTCSYAPTAVPTSLWRGARPRWRP
ncbi:MAG: hypothetical protein IPH38_16535 [Candidatus Microthrix sp.]|nr:hypothetical protein [Candidatus Microthrix sp.]MBK7021143.1 hypothetical protein [Candidatus Microthrix sp.]